MRCTTRDFVPWSSELMLGGSLLIGFRAITYGVNTPYHPRRHFA